MIYWDTSCVLKLYVEESDSETWFDQALTLEEPFVASTLLLAELTCALHAKESRGELHAGGAAALKSLFDQDVEEGRFTLIPVGSDVIADVGDIASACLNSGEPILLRTLDAIHLATAMRLKCTLLVTADDRMKSMAGRLGIQTL